MKLNQLVIQFALCIEKNTLYSNGLILKKTDSFVAKLEHEPSKELFLP